MTNWPKQLLHKTVACVYEVANLLRAKEIDEDRISNAMEQYRIALAGLLASSWRRQLSATEVQAVQVLAPMPQKEGPLPAEERLVEPVYLQKLSVRKIIDSRETIMQVRKTLAKLTGFRPGYSRRVEQISPRSVTVTMDFTGAGYTLVRRDDSRETARVVIPRGFQPLTKLFHDSITTTDVPDLIPWNAVNLAFLVKAAGVADPSDLRDRADLSDRERADRARIRAEVANLANPTAAIPRTRNGLNDLRRALGDLGHPPNQEDPTGSNGWVLTVKGQGIRLTHRVLWQCGKTLKSVRSIATGGKIEQTPDPGQFLKTGSRR